MSSRPIVTVLSATGTQGKAVTKALSASGSFNIRALTRDTKSEKAQEISKLPNVTLTDANDLDKAFKNAFAVFAYSFTSFESSEEIDYMKNVADSAENAGVKLFTFSSLPSAKEESNGKYTGIHQFENKQVIEKYLKTLKMKSVILHVSFFVENFANYGLLNKDGDKLSLVLSFANPETSLPMTNIEPDLGQAVSLIFQNYEKQPSLFESPVHITSYEIPFGEHADILKKVTGKEVITVPMSTPTGGQNAAVDEVREFIDDIGIFRGVQLPDPRLTEIGYKPHDFEFYIRNTVIPALGLD